MFVSLLPYSYQREICPSRTECFEFTYTLLIVTNICTVPKVTKTFWSKLLDSCTLVRSPSLRIPWKKQTKIKVLKSTIWSFMILHKNSILYHYVKIILKTKEIRKKDSRFWIKHYYMNFSIVEESYISIINTFTVRVKKRYTI